MVNCAVVNCAHRTDKYRSDYKNGVRFFSIPKVITTQCDLTRKRSERRRALWLSKLNRKDLQEADVKAHTKVCNAHFIKGAPAALWDENNPDWAPSQNMGYFSSSEKASSAERFERKQRRAARKDLSTTNIDLPIGNVLHEEPAAATDGETEHEQPVALGDFPVESVVCQDDKSCVNSVHDGNVEINTREVEVDTPPAVPLLDSVQGQCCKIHQEYADVRKNVQTYRDLITNLEVDKSELQTSLTAAENMAELLRAQASEVTKALERNNEMLGEELRVRESMQGQLQKCLNDLQELRQQVADFEVKTFTKLDVFLNCEARVRFYTGLPSSAVFKTLLGGLASYFEEKNLETSRYKLEPWQCLLLTLMRMRLALSHQDLAYRFGVSKATAVRVFDMYLDAMYHSVYPALVKWPDRETLWETMPREFREAYGNSVAVIIDCFEVFTDKPSSLEPASVWSNYKHHHTVKILVGISPTGAVIFVSTAWGARASDKHLVQESGLYEILLPHDVVMADRGFNIGEELALRQAKLLIPAFTRGQTQLSSHDVTLTRKIANLRIHVERVIGLVRRKFRILKSILPVALLTKKDGDEFAPIDKIVRVCCALVNTCPSIVVHPDVHEQMDI